MCPDALSGSAPDPHPIEHLVIVGNGMATQRLVATLVRQAKAPRRITVIGEERCPAYNRILLSPWLAGDMSHNDLRLPEIADRAGIALSTRLGERVTRIDRARRRVLTARGEALAYDRLVLATGSRTALPPVPGIELAGVSGFRDLDDAEALAAAAQRGGRALVVGGGLLGLEAAEGLRQRGMQARVLQRSERLMNRQLDATAATLLRRELEGRGLAIATGVELATLEDDGHGHVAAARLANGERLPADRVVIAAGITPNAELGREAGLACDRAIRVDAWLTTSDPDIHALGECCQVGTRTFGLVEPIWQQVEVLARHLAGEATPGFVDAPTATKLKVGGVSLYAFGPTEAGPGHEALTYHDPQQGEYRRLLLRDGRLEGAVLYGDTAMGPWLFTQARAGTRLDAARQALALGQADVEALLAEHESPLRDTDSPEKEAA
ncbi:NAD(P)/FAD-dependent oxidoreductase [Halomonas maura]|uniref:NAD(P)/FAD-dependent oxidoreductase n=1 Tax=Halomonas maura TaxID=117606 RepID=UPI0025B314F1|nr:FAD-dependent oxidoreductase [Halomonas maura]MDN3556571.1 FAD-dependent oxidoreductase [Halomonas maura]